MAPVTVSELEMGADGPLLDGAVALEAVLTAEHDPSRDPETRACYRSLRRSTDAFAQEIVVAVTDGRVVGRADLEWWSVEGNTDKLDVNIAVHPDERRRGIGTRLLASVLGRAEALGRTSIIGWGPHGEASDGFWTAAGAPLKMVERQSRLWVGDVDGDLMERWVEDHHTGAPGYTLIHYRGDTPIEHLDAVAELFTAMNDAPLDDLDYDDDIWTADDVRGYDERARVRDVERWVSMVLAPDGSPAGFTNVGIVRPQPGFSNQGDTVVVETHRGHGIGRWLKADMWQRLRRDAPGVRALDTANAASNEHMLAINVAMGFERVYEDGVWQASTAELARHVS